MLKSPSPRAAYTGRMAPTCCSAQGSCCRSPFPFGVGLLVIIIGVAAALWRAGNRETPPPAAEQAPLSAAPDPLATLAIPDFDLIDQEGAPQTRDIFKGRWTVLAFTFTNCTTVCPPMAANLLRIQGAAGAVPLRIATISVDPTHDTPPVLRAKAAKIGADPARWSFLTGEPATIRRILASLRFAVEDDPSLTIALPDGSTMANIIHPSKLLLIGPDITVRAMESGVEPTAADAILNQARELIAQTR